MNFRLKVGAFVCLALLALCGCKASLETDQARLCRIALPALFPPELPIEITSQTEDADGKGLVEQFRVEQGTHTAHCRFRSTGRPNRSEDLTALALDETSLGAPQLYFLIRFWLSTAEARGADPAPFGDLSGLPDVPRSFAYALQQAINALPATAVYALLAAAYSLIYGLVGRINLAFGEFAAIGGYGAAFGAGLTASVAPGPELAIALVIAIFVAGSFGVGASRFVFQPLHRATGQIVIVASVGLALFLQELLRLTQGSNLHWVSPVLNMPFGLARSGDFVVVATPNALFASVVTTGAAAGLALLMKVSRFGRDWRAYADDRFAAALCGIDPAAVFARTFVLACALAGLAGYVMTMIYGSVGYGAAATLGLKALVASILGGIGSIPGAFLGGIALGALEASWSSLFPIDYRDTVVFAALAVTLIWRPGGILGARESAGRWA